MSGLDRQPGREAAVQGLLQLWGGAGDADERVLRLMSSTPLANYGSISLDDYTYPKNGSVSTVLSALAEVLRRCTVASQEPERYVLGWALEVQRRVANAQARAVFGHSAVEMSHELWQQRCSFSAFHSQIPLDSFLHLKNGGFT